MFGIKKLYTFVLQSFFPILLATFAVCLFFILMQFLWRYVDDMVGKGLEMTVLLKMLFYAALAFVPLALPLAILLASLMIFGNLGESLELLAIKSAGVSLQKIMRPLIIFLIFVSAGSFYFQNNILPISQVKMWTILWSIRQTSPELDIPEGVFYQDIPNYNVYVNHKNRKTGILHDMMIYDFSDGFDNAKVYVADSGKLASSDDKKNLVLTLYSGESFENFKTQRSYTHPPQQNIPYMRQSFNLRQILIEFDTNFKMADESLMGGKEIAKNLNELNSSIDSMKIVCDNSKQLTQQTFRTHSFRELVNPEKTNSGTDYTRTDTFTITSFDDFFASKSLQDRDAIINRAKLKADAVRNEYSQKEFTQSQELKELRYHQIEMQKRFSLSFACLIFFFIGAPLGAIIRKGGLGMPTVISVFLFIFYYTLDFFGTKMAKQGAWPVWQGMWISSAILLGLGVFLTYKAVNDSVMLNAEVWVIFFKRFFGKRDVRNYTRKEVIITPPEYEKDIERINAVEAISANYLEYHQYPDYFSFWKKGFSDNAYQAIIDERESIIEDLLNSSENIILGKLMDYPILKVPNLNWLNAKETRWICMIVFPIGLIIYGIGLIKIKNINQDLKTTLIVDPDLKKEISNLLERHNSRKRPNSYASIKYSRRSN